MNAIQALRNMAVNAGNLKSTTQQTVEVQPAQSAAQNDGQPAVQPTVIIQPAQPNTVYVPQYDPTTAYGAPVPAPPDIAELICCSHHPQDAQPAPARTSRRRNRHRRPRAGPAGGLVPAHAGRSRPRTRHRRARLVGATARLALAPPRRAAARRAPAPQRHPGHRPRRRRPRTSPLALPP